VLVIIFYIVECRLWVNTNERPLYWEAFAMFSSFVFIDNQFRTFFISPYFFYHYVICSLAVILPWNQFMVNHLQPAKQGNNHSANKSWNYHHHHRWKPTLTFTSYPSHRLYSLRLGLSSCFMSISAITVIFFSCYLLWNWMILESII